MSLNKAILIGRLTRDPELRYMPNGDAVCNFGLATSESWKDQSGAKQERTEFHNITMYRRLAEIAGQYLKKGSQVYIEGKIQSRKYTGKDGVERTAYEIIAGEMKMLGGKSDNGGGQSSGFTAQQYAAASGGTPPAPPQQRPQPQGGAQQPIGDIDDDIPF